MTIETPIVARFPRSVIPAWLLVVVGALLVGFLSPRADAIGWLPVVLFGGVIVTFAIQIGVDEKVGLVNRVMVSLGGSVIILAVATAVFAIIAA